MPGNEVGDRVHNFFDQSSLSQDQRHTQFGEANWPSIHNNAWAANERQIDGSLNTSTKNYSGQQSEIERGQNNQFSLASHGSTFTQSSGRPEFAKSPSQAQRVNLNGFMHTPLVDNGRQSEAIFLGMDRESDRHNMTSRVLSNLQTQQRSIQQQNNSSSFGGSQAPMNLNFLGGQQQMSAQQSGMVQSFPMQQSGINDAQLMQQQAIFKQMQELQRRQQLQQFEAMQRSATNHMSSFPNMLGGQHSQAINGNPWQSQVMAGGTNWQQPGQPSSVNAYANGLMVHPEQGQAMHFMGLTPQQASQSLYGVPVSNSTGANPFSQISREKPGVYHMPHSNSPFSANPYASHGEQVSMQDANTTSRSGSEGKTSFEHGPRQGSENTVDLGGFNQVQQRTLSMSDDGRRGFVNRVDVSPEKSLNQGVISQTLSSQAVVGLDPTEEKILFGNDDNIWEAFGGESVTGNDGADLFNGIPSLQSGTWSALMQSAVAETSSGDGGTQEEWSGLESQNSRSQSRNQHLPTSQDNEKSSPVWIDSSQRASLGNFNGSHNPSLHQSFSNLGSAPRESQVLQEGRRWLDSNSPKPHTEEKREAVNPNSAKVFSKTDTGFWSHHQSSFLTESVPGSNTNSKVESGNTNTGREYSQRPPDNRRLDNGKQGNFAAKSGIVGSGNVPTNMNKVQSAVNDFPGGRVADIHGKENGVGNDSHQNRFPNHALPGYSTENAWSDTGRRLPVARKFQYHPMGDVDIDESSSVKEVLTSQSMSPSSGFEAHAARPPLFSPAGPSLSDKDKGTVSGFHGGVGMLHGGFSSSVHSGYLTTPFPRSDEQSSPSQHMPQSQDMLELLHKVDRSPDQNAVSNRGSISTRYHKSSDILSSGRVGPDQSQSSSSHSFNLQLAPPSQGITFSNLNDPSQGVLGTVGSPNTQLVSSEKEDNSHSRLTLGSSAHGLPPSHRPPQLESGDNKTGCSDGSVSIMKGGLSASLVSNSAYMRNPFQNQHITASGRQIMDDHQSSIVSSDRHAYRDQQSTITQNQAPTQGGLYSRTSQQQILGVQARNVSNFMKSHFQTNDSSDMSSFSQQKKDEVDGPNEVDGPRSTDAASSLVADPQFFGKRADVSQKEHIERQTVEVSFPNSDTSQDDAHMFHHSLKPNNMSNHSYSLQNQMQAMNNTGVNPSHRESKRFRGPENGPYAPQMAGNEAEPTSGAMNSLGRDPSVSQTFVSSGDAKLGVSAGDMNRNISQLPHGGVASQDTLAFGRSDPQTFFAGRAQGTDVDPQMDPPAVLDKYRTLKNGQLFPVNNMLQGSVAKNVEQQFIKPPSNVAVQNSAQLNNAVMDTCQNASSSQIKIAYPASEHMSLPHAFDPRISSPSPVPMGPKKRKTATSDLIPWNKEISQGFKRVQNVSSAEVEWAQSSNRLVERGGDEIDSREDMSSMIRPRRRLILTTKLMQQVICPPPASILSLDGRSNYEVTMYSIARQALGDACNLVCAMESELSPDIGNALSAKATTSDRIRDQNISKVMEDFTNRAKELDHELPRLDKRASILDFRLECQDLERFSIINRFARFHGRSQAEGVETSSSSDANAISQKPLPQRYVTAHPMPMTVPERVQCLTLN